MDYAKITTMSISARERDAARFMPLNGAARSDAAVKLIARLTAVDSAASSKRRLSRFVGAAIAALVCDLLKIAEDGKWRWGYRPLGRDNFSGQRIGYRVFVKAIDVLEATGNLERRLGHMQWAGFERGFRVQTWARATRFRGTTRFFDTAHQEGVTPENWSDHFSVVTPATPLAVRNPLVCRRSAARAGRERWRGSALRLDLSDTTVRRLRTRIASLNDFVSRQVIGGQEHRGFRRIFNGGEALDYRWNKGGRLYSIGGGYQTAKRADRAQMTINGEPVVEVDIRASHLTILHALRGFPFDATQDPYIIEGLPRPVVKSWVVMTLGHREPHQRWSVSARRKLEPLLHCSLEKAFPLDKTQRRILAHLPVLANWQASGFGVLDVQFMESEAIIGAIEMLAFSHGIPSLPIHDSLVVPASQASVASEVLAAIFERVVGIRPFVRVLSTTG